MKKRILVFMAGLFMLTAISFSIMPASADENCEYITDIKGAGWGAGPLTGGDCWLWNGQELIYVTPITACYPAYNSPGCIAYGCKTWLDHCFESTNPIEKTSN